MREVRIGKHTVGAGHRPFVIAEMSGNHNGLGADGVLQPVRPDRHRPARVARRARVQDRLRRDRRPAADRAGRADREAAGQNLYSLYEKAHTPWEWHAPIFERAAAQGLTVFSSPFDATAIELLEGLDAPAYKIASAEIVDLPLIDLCARTGKPLIISTGMANVAEIHAAVATARAAGNDQLIVLGCTASYPASPADSNLRGIPLIADTFDVVPGLSDHTLGIGVPVAAVALGACAVEKHVTLDRGDGGVDSDFSLEPAELAALAVETERAWQALGAPRIGPKDSEREVLRLRRSLYVVADVNEGDEVTAENVRSIRPSGGLPPAELSTVVGRRFRVKAAKGTPLTWDLI